MRLASSLNENLFRDVTVPPTFRDTSPVRDNGIRAISRLVGQFTYRRVMVQAQTVVRTFQNIPGK